MALYCAFGVSAAIPIISGYKYSFHAIMHRLHPTSVLPFCVNCWGIISLSSSHTFKMGLNKSHYLAVLLGISQVSAQSCQLQFDGRVPADFSLSDFDTANDLFNPDYVKGRGTAIFTNERVMMELIDL
jgi:hypothetical protein